MRKKFIFAAALCLTTLSPVYNVNAAVQVTQEIQQDGQTIRGKVIDNTGEPVIGANVTIKGTTNGVIYRFTAYGLSVLLYFLRHLYCCIDIIYRR